MADKFPLKIILDGSSNATAVGEFVPGDTIGLAQGGTGATSAAAARANLGIGTAVSVNSDTHAAALKITPVDADEFPLVDSATAFSLKKLTWSNFKAGLKTYFDSMYVKTVGGTAANALTLLGTNWDAPGPIGQGTAFSGNFASLSVAGTLPGNLILQGSVSQAYIQTSKKLNILTTSTTDDISFQNSFGEYACIDFSGKVTLGGTKLNPNLEVSNLASTSKHIIFSGNTPGNNPYFTSSDAGPISCLVSFSYSGLLSNGALSFVDTDIQAQFVGNVNSYAQVVIQNKNAGTAASGSLVVANNNGTATTNYGEFGINSSGFTGTGSFNAAGYTYAYSATTDFVIGTLGANNLRFVTNNAATDAMVIDPTGLVKALNSFQINGKVGFGITPSVAAGIYHYRGNTTGAGTAFYGVNQTIIASAETTSSVFGNLTSIGTNAAAFTVTDIYHNYATQSTIGAGSAVTNQTAYYADVTLVGATNNYGFRSAIPATAGRWNFYASGAANNAYAGNSSFGKVTAPTCAVDTTSEATSLVTNAAATYTVLTTDSTIIQTTAASTYTLPAAAFFPGRKLHLVTQFAGAVISNASNVVPLAGGAAVAAILAATAGKFATLQSNGTAWIIIAAN